MGRVCSLPGCPALATDGSRCAEHKWRDRRRKPRGDAQRAYDRQRPSRHERGYDSKWDKARRAFLAKHPLCACGCGQRAVDVHHERPWLVDGVPDWKLFWDRNNWRGLAHGCHSRVTRRQARDRGTPVPPAAI